MTRTRTGLLAGMALAAALWSGAAAAGERYGFVSMGLGAARHQFDTAALGGPGRIREAFEAGGASLGVGIGWRDVARLGEMPVDIEIEVRASRTERFARGSHSYVLARQQVGVAAWATLAEGGGVRVQAGLGAGARRLAITYRDGALSRFDVDRAPYAMAGLRAVREMGDGRRGFVELRYTVHPTPKGPGQTASIEHEMNDLEVLVGVQQEF